MADPQPPQGEEAQLMLLGAILVLLAFFAILAVTVRVGNVPAQTAAAGVSPLPHEAESVLASMEAIAVLVDQDSTAAGLPFQTSWWQSSLAHLAVEEAARGYRLSYPVQGACLAGEVSVMFTLDDGSTRATFPYARTGLLSC